MGNCFRARTGTCVPVLSAGHKSRETGCCFPSLTPGVRSPSLTLQLPGARRDFWSCFGDTAAGWACGAQPPIPSARLRRIQSSAEEQHLESRAPGSLGSGMRLVLILLGPLPRCCREPLPVVGRAVPAASLLLSWLLGTSQHVALRVQRHFTLQSGAAGAAGREAQEAALFQLRPDKSCFSAVCPSAFNSEGDVQVAGRACRGHIGVLDVPIVVPVPSSEDAQPTPGLQLTHPAKPSSFAEVSCFPATPGRCRGPSSAG